MDRQITTTNVAATQAAAGDLAGLLQGHENLLLFGQLGSGKTAFTQGLAAALQVSNPVKSPTYTYLHEYAIPMRSTTLAHFDLYRLPARLTEHDLRSIGLLDRWENQDTITVIEWADRLPNTLQQQGVAIRFAHDPKQPNARSITLPILKPRSS